MRDRKLLESLGGWQGYGVERVEWPEGIGRTLSIYLTPTAKGMRCEQCGARCLQMHEATVRRVRDLPLFEYRVVLHVPRQRLWCEQCGGPRLERLAGLGRYQRVTDRLAQTLGKTSLAPRVRAGRAKRAALNTFAQRLKGYLHGILARCRHPLNTRIVEGINNTIKVIKRRGYRDQEYFFLTIRAAFPGNARRTFFCPLGLSGRCQTTTVDCVLRLQPCAAPADKRSPGRGLQGSVLTPMPRSPRAFFDAVSCALYRPGTCRAVFFFRLRKKQRPARPALWAIAQRPFSGACRHRPPARRRRSPPRRPRSGWRRTSRFPQWP